MEALAHEQLRRLERDHWWMRGRRRVYLELLRAVQGEAPVECALDVGAGAGGFAVELGRMARRVVAVDTDLDGLAHCRARGVHGALLAASERLPLAPASCDLVCLFDVLEHLDDEGRALAEVRRVLRPGGRLFVSVPAYPFLYAENDRVVHHKRRYTRATLARAVRAAGFSIERNTHANVLLTPVIVPAILLSKARAALWPRRGPARTNLSWVPPRALNELFYRLFAAELVASRRVDVPFGHSIALSATAPVA